MPYHVRISTHSQRAHDEVRLDVTADELESRFLAPYREGRAIVIKGRTIHPPDIARIVITKSDETSEVLRPLVIAEERASSVVTGIPLDWLIAAHAKDVTDEFINTPPGYASTHAVNPTGQTLARGVSRDEAHGVLMQQLGLLRQISSSFARGQEGVYRRRREFSRWWEGCRSDLLRLFNDAVVADRVLPAPTTYVADAAPTDVQFDDVNGQIDGAVDRLAQLIRDFEHFETYAASNPLERSLEPLRQASTNAASRRVAHDVFICHASEDKDAVARPLAELLRALGVNVWYDEFTLRIGDSLHRAIDRGLADSRFGVVILSQAFFAKRWPQRELDGLVTKEMAGTEQLILPIWHGIGQKEVAGYSLPLADKVARSTAATNLEAIAAEIMEIVQR